MNQLYYGDNLEVLRKYVREESVDLCYIDPPFNSKRNYNQIYNNVGKEDVAQAQAFMDTWTWNHYASIGLDEIERNVHQRLPLKTIELIRGLVSVLGKGSLMAYLVSMTNRLAEIYRVLKPTGSFYLHCDPSASHYLKLILDSIYCSQGGEFQNEIIWKRTNSHNDTKQGRKAFGNITDVILFYTKTKQHTFNPAFTPYHQDYIKSTYKNVDADGRRWKSSDLSGPGGAANGNPLFEFLGVTRYWRYSHENLLKLYEQGRIYQSKPGAVPRLKHYLDEMLGIPVQNLWDDIAPLSAHAKERLGYPTQKPETLLERIIKTSSNEGDTVLDAYCGCGTTVAVSQRLNRRWIGIDVTYQAISLILKRIEESYGKQAFQKIALHGVPEDFASAEALAHKSDDRTRKEFEKWAILQATDNRAMINEKKGKDGGIDGIAYGSDYADNRELTTRILFSVKSGKNVNASAIRDLYGTVEREKAARGYLITLYPMENLMRESQRYGIYEHQSSGQKLPKIDVISVPEILSGKRAIIPMSVEVLKRAERQQYITNQYSLFGG